MNKKKFNIQFFAEDPTPPNPNPNPSDPNPGGDQNPVNEVVFTPVQQEYIDKLINRTIGKIKAQMDAERAKYEEEMQRKAELEKIKDEKERKLKEYELKFADLEKEKAAIAKERMTNKAMTMLSEKKLPVNVAEFLVKDSEEETVAAITKFEKAFNEAVGNEVNMRLKGNPPIVNPGNPNPIDITKLSTEEYIRLRKENKI